MKVIDIDSHSRPRSEDYDLTPEYVHLKPQDYLDEEGNRVHLFNGKVVSRISSREITKAQASGKGGWNAGRYDGSARYEHITEAGIDFQFVSAEGAVAFSYVDPKAGAALCRASNDFLYRTFVKPYPRTFSALPTLPLQDVGEAARELERCVKDLGARSLFMSPNWNGIDMADPHWWKFWDQVRALEITGVVVHATVTLPSFVGKERLGVLGPEGATGPRMVVQPFEYSTNILNLIFGGMMDRFPELRFAFLEMGAEFAMAFKHRIEENLAEMVYLRDKLSHPLEWYFDRFYFLVDDRMLENDGKLFRYAIEELGADQLFFASDYPHTDGHLDMCGKLKETHTLSEEEKEKILGRNALVLMGKGLV